MESISIIINILLSVILICSIFFRSFLQEKGKNLATKEDIGKITEEIEKVKNEFSLKSQKETDFFFEKKKSLLEFYDSYFIWVDSEMRIADIIICHNNNSEMLRQTIQNLKKAHINVLKFYSRLIIYDFVFAKKLTSIYSTTIDNHNLVIRFLITLEDISIQYKNLKSNIDLTTDEKDFPKIKESYDKLVEERNKCFEDFHEGTEKLKKKLEENKLQLKKIYMEKIYKDYGINPPSLF